MKHAMILAALLVLAPAGAQAERSAPVDPAPPPQMASLPVAGQVQALAQRKLSARLAVVAVTLSGRLASLTVDAEVTALSWRGAPGPGWLVVQVRVRTPGGREELGWARIEICERRRVLVAARALARGGVVRDGDLVTEERAVDRREGWDIAPSALAGAEILADVPIGAVLDSHAIAEPAPVARGTVLRVVVRRGAVVVSASGKLERQARPGELTSVRLGNQRVVRGRLDDPTTLIVGETP
jgi:flagella basal body P-ring formation protein FlgA